MIVFIPCSGDGCKACRSGGFDGEWLPRDCPGCGARSVIGHGRRLRRAFDPLFDSVRIRRALCRNCHRTITVLPCFCIPGAQFSAPARREAMDRLAEGRTLEDAAPVCLNPDRLAAPSTVRRWAWQRISRLRLVLFLSAPTIAVWHSLADSRILGVEPLPP